MKKLPLVGRLPESAILNEALETKEAEMIAIVGRRRVGKTYLVEQVYSDKIVFELTGSQRASLKQQLGNFRNQLTIAAGAALPLELPTDWHHAFLMLRQFLQSIDSREKVVIFFDELPWLSNSKSGFLEALGYFWNSWASRQQLVIVLCGSAASWMLQKVVKDTGGLHNRITRRIHLKPFTLAETEQFLSDRGILWDRYSILQFYMVTGGIPHYLKEARPGKSPAQVIDQSCFSATGLLRDEFNNLYPALFRNATLHTSIVRTLFQKKSGMTRQELISKFHTTSGGSMTTALDELEQSGFVNVYYPFGKKVRDKVWRLTDEYSLFYLQFIEDKLMQREHNWMNLMDSQSYKTWSGFAFENICLQHLPQIKKALGISGVYTEASAFYKKGDDESDGAQIDLILERKDRVINLFEIKFYSDKLYFSPTELSKLRSRQSVFVQTTQTKKFVSWVLVTTFGLKNPGGTDHVLTLDDLFL